MTIKKEDYYSFEYDCSLKLMNEDEEWESYDTVISIEVLWDDTSQMYEVNYSVRNTSEMDFQDDYDLFIQVEEQLLSDLSSHGITRSMLIYS